MNKVKKTFTLLRTYFSRYFLSALFFGYLGFSVILKVLTGYDITLGCPVKYTTGIECLGCGLTTATVSVLKFDLLNAWEANPLVFIVLPLIGYLFIRHFYRYYREETTSRNKYESRL